MRRCALPALTALPVLPVRPARFLRIGTVFAAAFLVLGCAQTESPDRPVRKPGQRTVVLVPVASKAPLDATELRVLTRSMELSPRFDKYDALDMGACIEENLSIAIASPSQGAPEDAARRAAIGCSPGQSDALRKFATDPVRRVLRTMVIRLNPYFTPFKLCTTRSVDLESLRRCAQDAAGRPLEPDELQALWAAHEVISR